MTTKELLKILQSLPQLKCEEIELTMKFKKNELIDSGEEDSIKKKKIKLKIPQEETVDPDFDSFDGNPW